MLDISLGLGRWLSGQGPHGTEERLSVTALIRSSPPRACAPTYVHIHIKMEIEESYTPLSKHAALVTMGTDLRSGKPIQPLGLYVHLWPLLGLPVVLSCGPVLYLFKAKPPVKIFQPCLRDVSRYTRPEKSTTVYKVQKEPVP